MSRTKKGSKGPGWEPWSNLEEKLKQQADYIEEDNTQKWEDGTLGRDARYAVGVSAEDEAEMQEAIKASNHGTKLTIRDVQILALLDDDPEPGQVRALASQLLSANKIIDAARWQLYYHPEDTIEALETAVRAHVEEFGE